MTYTPEQLDAIQVENHNRCVALIALKKALRQVLNSPKHEGLSNFSKADILLELENGGEYNPLG